MKRTMMQIAVDMPDTAGGSCRVSIARGDQRGEYDLALRHDEGGELRLDALGQYQIDNLCKAILHAMNSVKAAHQ